jgi:hypothetical protein
MEDIELLLKLIKKVGYPTSKFDQLCSFVGYDKDNFIIDLVDTYGVEKTLEFATKSILSLSEDGSGSFKLDLHPLGFDEESYLIIELYNFTISMDEIRCNYSFGSSLINHESQPEITTIDELFDDMDMTETWEFIDAIEGLINDKLEPSLGFKIDI